MGRSGANAAVGAAEYMGGMWVKPRTKLMEAETRVKTDGEDAGVEAQSSAPVTRAPTTPPWPSQSTSPSLLAVLKEANDDLDLLPGGILRVIDCERVARTA